MNMLGLRPVLVGVGRGAIGYAVERGPFDIMQVEPRSLCRDSTALMTMGWIR